MARYKANTIDFPDVLQRIVDEDGCMVANANCDTVIASCWLIKAIEF
jgi:hypothetical protein